VWLDKEQKWTGLMASGFIGIIMSNSLIISLVMISAFGISITSKIRTKYCTKERTVTPINKIESNKISMVTHMQESGVSDIKIELEKKNSNDYSFHWVKQPKHSQSRKFTEG